MSPAEDRLASPQPVVIREFRPGDQGAFRSLNEEWIARYFVMEPKDREALDDPERTILAPGGRIFFAAIDGQPVGCCALLRLREGEFEVAKMAVAPAQQGRGIGRKLLQAVVDAARASGIRRLYLETNHVLTPAIHLYESIGFRPVPADRVRPSPYARSDVSMEMTLA